MERPYTICHILSALDGKITGAFMGTKTAQTVSEEYARIRSEYQADAWLYGTVTTKEFTQGRKPELDSVTYGEQQIAGGGNEKKHLSYTLYAYAPAVDIKRMCR